MTYEERADDVGLGLEDFLDFDPDAEKSRRAGGEWLGNWKDKGKIVVWLHTKSPICPVWSHQFIYEDVVEDKETKKEKLILRWPRYVSLDGPKVHSNQYFREPRKNGFPQVPPDRDPFLLLREWLMRMGVAEKLPLDACVFEWVDRKNAGEVIRWLVGETSGIEKRGKRNRGHSLDTRLDYLFVVVPDDPKLIGEGPVLTRETKLLGDLMREKIQEEIESKGAEDGNPFKAPYAFKWVFDKNADSPMKMYKAFRFDQATCASGGDGHGDKVWEAITSESPPDPKPFAIVGENDQTKIRDHMEKAMQFDLPLDHIFSTEARDREAVWRGQVGIPTQRTSSSSGPSNGASSGEVRRPPATTGTARRRADSPPPETQEEADDELINQEEEPKPAPGPRARRRKVEEPPPKPPEPERIKCDDCDVMLLPTDAVCPGCGAKYTVDPDEQPAPAPKAPARPAPGQPAKAPDGPKRQAGGSTAGVKRSTPKEASDPEEGGAGGKRCFACDSDRLERRGETVVCLNCKQDQGDDIPFS